MKHTSLRPKQSLGQNFLRDENIARKISAAVDAGKNDIVLEIGPGEAALTKHLATRAGTLIVVEIDQRAIAALQERFPHGEIEILHADFLQVDFSSLLKGRAASRIRVVGNIPYNITSPILFHILDQREHVGDATLMMQREVARRLVAKPNTKEYGILAVFCQLFADVKLLFDVAPSCFYPRPKVTSSVVQLKLLPALRFEPHDEAYFRSMVRTVFGKRRKTLRNSLSYFVDERPDLPGFDLQKRPEALSIRELVELANALFQARK